MVLADSFDKFDRTYSECQFVNPGAFGLDFSFIEWYPATGELNLLTVQPDE